MRTVTPLAAGNGFAVHRVEVRSAGEGWWPPEAPSAFRVTFVRAGAFRALVGGRTVPADPSVAYLDAPGGESSIAHRAGSVDRCTAVEVSAPFLAELTGGAAPPAHATVDGRLAVAHRLLAARAATADPFELAERTARLLGAVLAARSAPKPDRQLVDRAREVLAADPAVPGLREVAARVGCSPYHLSRVFHAETGATLTAHRNRIRVHRALEAIEAGHQDLAGLAADLGFADHAHLTRTVRRECGHPPRALRRLLSAGN